MTKYSKASWTRGCPMKKYSVHEATNIDKSRGHKKMKKRGKKDKNEKKKNSKELKTTWQMRG